jgi:hypothetical protein
MKKISEEILNEEKNAIPTLEEMTEHYCIKNKIMKQELSGRQKHIVYENMIYNLGFWLVYRIIFDSKKNNLDEINVTLQDELEILNRYVENLYSIQSEFLKDIEKNPNHNRKIKALENNEIFKEFCELYPRVNKDSEKTDRIFIQREMSCIKKLIKRINQGIKRKNENNVSQSLSDQEAVTFESKKRKSS